MNSKLWKIGLFTGLISFVLFIVGMRTILGQTLSVKNYFAFGLFGLIVGIFSILLLYFKLKIAYRIFIVALVLGFAEYFRSILMDLNGFGDLVGILSLYIITSFGLGIAVFVQFIVIFVRKNKE
jgi:NAD/NADP transhydrogenase beta subunit